MSEIVHTQAKRLYESISRTAGSDAADSILEELPLSKTPTDKRRGEWACSSCKSLCEHFDSETVEEIRKNCHCKPSPPSVKLMKQLWDDSSCLEEFVENANKQAEGAYELESVDGVLLMKYPVCYCSFLRRTNVQVPVEWCYCTVGYSEDMFSAVTGRKVTCKLLESIASGDKKCRIEIQFIS